MRSFIVIILSILSLQTYSQYSLDWGELIGGKMSQSALDKDSNIYIAGNFENTIDFDPGSGLDYKSPLGGYDFYIVKLNKNGDYQWSRTFGTTACTPCHDEVFDIAVDSKGNVVLTGAFFGPLDFDPSPTSSFIMRSGDFFTVNYVLKLDSLGDFVWAKKFQNTIFASGNGRIKINNKDEIFYITPFMDSIDADPSGATLYFKTAVSGTENTLIAKLKSSGNLIWARQIEGGYNKVDKLTLIDNNTILLAGQYKGLVDFDIRNSAASTLNSGTSTHTFLLKLTSDTSFGFVKDFSCTNLGTMLGDIHSTNSGSILLSGNFTGTVDFNPGTAVVSKTAAISTGDAFILKLDNNGNFNDVFTFGGAGVYQNVCNSITEDSSGNLFFGGSYMSTVDFDKGAGISTHTSVGFLDAFILKTTANLDYINSFSIGGNKWEQVENLFIGDNDKLILIGGFSSTSGDLDPSSSTFPISMPSGSVVGNYTLKISMSTPSSTSINELYKTDITLFPNPANNLLQVKGVSGNSAIKVISSEGRIVFIGNYSDASIKINVSELASGIYSVIIIDTENERNVVTKKFIKM